MRKVVCFILCLSMFLVTGCGLLPEEEELRKAPVIQSIDEEYFTTVTVKTGDVVDYFSVRGKYQKQETQTLQLSSWEEELKDLYVAVGDRVSSGDVLAELTVGDLDSQIEEQQKVCDECLREKEYVSTLVSLENERKDLAKKYKRDYDKEVLENLKARLEKAEDNYYIADLKLGELQAQLDKKRLVSGINGVVTEIEYTHGWDWNKNTGVVITVESEKYGFVFTTDQVDSFEIGTVCEIEMDNGEILNAEVITSVATNDQGTMVKVTMEPILTNAAIIAGDMGTIKVTKAAVSNVVYVPYGSLRKIGDDYAVYVVNQDGLRERRIIKVGLIVSGRAISDDNRVEVIEGVSVGEEVIIR